MKSYRLQKVDTNLYIKGLSGPMVYKAARGIIAVLLIFVVLYLTAGAFWSVAVSIPLFFGYLYHLNRIQKRFGPDGWEKRKTAKKLPGFIRVRKRIHQSFEL